MKIGVIAFVLTISAVLSTNLRQMPPVAAGPAVVPAVTHKPYIPRSPGPIAAPAVGPVAPAMAPVTITPTPAMAVAPARITPAPIVPAVAPATVVPTTIVTPRRACVKPACMKAAPVLLDSTITPLTEVDPQTITFTDVPQVDQPLYKSIYVALRKRPSLCASTAAKSKFVQDIISGKIASNRKAKTLKSQIEALVNNAIKQVLATSTKAAHVVSAKRKTDTVANINKKIRSLNKLSQANKAIQEAIQENKAV